MVWLLLFDQLVPPILDRLERRRYEDDTAFRFESSDLFGLSPFVRYLREHPRHQRPRIVFFGNSVTFGYELTPAQAVPAQFQKLHPDARVYNIGINEQQIGTNYLIAKDIVDSVDEMYVQIVGSVPNPLLPSLIPVDDADLRRFDLPAPNAAETALRSWLGRAWHLYGVNDRLQAAIFGTSTRVYLHNHKRDLLLLRAPAAPPAAPSPPMHGHIALRAPRAPANAPPVTMTPWFRMQFDFAELVRAHGKRAVFIQYEYGPVRSSDAEVAEFNAKWAPVVEEVIITLPPGATYDGIHPLPAAATEIAEALSRREWESWGRR